MVVKVALDGQIYADHQQVSLEELAERVVVLNRENGSVTYYRESPETEGTELTAKAFAALLEMRPRIRLGQDAPSEWGRLDWVEVEQAPRVARFFLARHQKFLISMPSSGADLQVPVRVGGPLLPQQEEMCFNEIDLLIRSDRVLETPSHNSELSMNVSAQREPSLHVRIAYDRSHWASCYPIDEVPSNINSFHADLWRFAQRFIDAIERNEWRAVTADEARRLFK